MKRIVTNINTGVDKYFDNDEDFLEYVKILYRENEEGNPYPSTIHWEPENIQQASEYIHEYCSDLILTVD